MLCGGMRFATSIVRQFGITNVEATVCSNNTYRNLTEENVMNKDRIEGNWKELKGKAQQQWGELTNDELDQIEGNRTELVGKLQQKYGKTKEEAEREVDDFLNKH